MSNERGHNDDDDVAGVENRKNRKRIVIDADQVIIRANKVIIHDESDDKKDHHHDHDHDDRRDDRRDDRKDDRKDDRRDDRRTPFWWI